MNREPETKCERCQAEIYKHERRYLLRGRWVCEDCFLATVSRNPRDLANALGVEVEVYGRG